jgi:hypothetical protein
MLALLPRFTGMFNVLNNLPREKLVRKPQALIAVRFIHWLNMPPPCVELLYGFLTVFLMPDLFVT